MRNKKKKKQIIQEIIKAQAGSSGPRPSLDKGTRRSFKPKKKSIRNTRVNRGPQLGDKKNGGGIKATPLKGNGMTGIGSSSHTPGPDDMCVIPMGQQIPCEDCNVVNYFGGDALSGPGYYLCGPEGGVGGTNDTDSDSGICYNMLGQVVPCDTLPSYLGGSMS